MNVKFIYNKKSFILLLFNLLLSLAIILIISPKVWFLSFIAVYFYILGIFSSVYLEKKLKSSPNKFISQYMIVSMFRLVLHIIIIILLFLNLEERFIIAGIFFLNYITSTIFEANEWLSTKNKS